MRAYEVPLVALCAIVTLLLIWFLFRTRALASSNRQLITTAAQQSCLNDAAVGFARADSLESTAEAAVTAAVALADQPESWSAFLWMAPTGLTVAATAGPAPSRTGEPIGEELVTQWRVPTSHDRLVEPDEQLTGQPSSFPELCAIPVFVGDGVHGKLVVGGIPANTQDLLPMLRRLCDQMGLVLVSIEAAEDRLQRSERKFRSLVQHSSDTVTLLGPDGVVSYQSVNGRTMLGYEIGELLGKTFVWLTHPDDAAFSRAKFIEVVRGGSGTRVEYECRFLHVDGGWRQVESIMTNLLDDPDVRAIVSNSRDVTERRALEQELSHQAFHDSLTGLANRALFLDRVAHALDRAERQSVPVAVMFVDIDDFKVVNDSLGHHFGDEVLVAVAELLKAAIRPGDTVARLGGDEFALLLDTGDMPEAAELVARRIAACLHAPIRTGREDISIRASIGIALGLPTIDGPDGLLRDADLAMYMAKRNGKGRFEMFHPAMHEEAVLRLETAADLRRGLEESHFEVCYQPIIDLCSGSTIGAEALVRWHHPTRGLVSPADFISVAESTGLIVQLGTWVLTESCNQVQSWRQSGDVDDSFYISVNLSARQLQDPGLIEDVARSIHASGLAAPSVVLEVTESMIIDDLDSTLSRLQALKDLGLRLAVDDFGTGYSSLSYLRNFPMDIVKIDKSFVDRISLDPAGTALVRGVIDLSIALGLKTIAEGVEGHDQLSILQELGCDGAQGFLFAAPMPSGDFANFLTGRHNVERIKADGRR
jgi:diguanylate cyclase (GGDEF)-like protein/PAS domain S-box-containing protein